MGTNDAARLAFWLRMIREYRGLSQADAAAAIGMSVRSKSTISAWEAGDRAPSLAQLRALAELYSVPIGLLVTPDPTAYEWLEERLRKRN